MSFVKYCEYKESQIHWIGSIPSEWELYKLSHAFGVIGSGTTPKSDEESWYCENDEGVSWVTTGELRENVIYSTFKNVTRDAVKAHSSLKIHPAGSLVIAMYGATIGRLGILGVDATTNQACCVLSAPKTLEPKYSFYWLSVYKDAIISLFSTGGGQPNINQETVASLRVSAPSSLSEQTQIARFLDHEVGKIDALIAEQEKLIALLKEKRQAVISHAVTKGLNPDVPMKDSGVEWLGQVPAHWIVKKLGYIGEAIIGLTYSPDDISDTGVLVLRSSNVQSGRLSFEDNVFVDKVIPEKLRTQKNDILICSRNGSRELIGKNALIDESAVGQTFGAFMTIFRSDVNFYLSQVFNSHIFSAQAGSFMTSTVNQLTTGNLNSFLVPMPPLQEMREIAIYLDRVLEEIDELIVESSTLRQVLTERRSALISAAVTGKIDVRSWQPPAAQ